MPRSGHWFIQFPKRELEALARARLPGRALSVALAVALLTWGWKKNADRISSTRLAELTGLPAGDVRKVLLELEASGIVARKSFGRGRRPELGIQDPQRWTRCCVEAAPQAGRVLRAGSNGAARTQHPGAAPGPLNVLRGRSTTHTRGREKRDRKRDSSREGSLRSRTGGPVHVAKALDELAPRLRGVVGPR